MSASSSWLWRGKSVLYGNRLVLVPAQLPGHLYIPCIEGVADAVQTTSTRGGAVPVVAIPKYTDPAFGGYRSVDEARRIIDDGIKNGKNIPEVGVFTSLDDATRSDILWALGPQKVTDSGDLAKEVASNTPAVTYSIVNLKTKIDEGS